MNVFVLIKTACQSECYEQKHCRLVFSRGRNYLCRGMKRYSLIVLSVFLGAMELFSQPLCGGRPVSVRKTLPQLRAVSQLPSRQQLMQGESAAMLNSLDAFAVPILTNLNPSNSGQWECAEGVSVWRLAISSPNAFSLNLIFTDFYLPHGAELYIYNSDTTVVLGAYTADNNADFLPTAPIRGDMVIVEYNEPDSVDFQGFFNIVQVAHDFRGAFAASADVAKKQCHFAPPTGQWTDEARAVCRILVGGTTLCTGTLLATADHSFEPYVLTARHCIYSEKMAQSSLFFFNFDTTENAGQQCVAGARLVAAKDNDNGFLDFSLVKLNGAIPEDYNVYYAGWDATADTAIGGGVCLHHPSGRAMAMAVATDTLRAASYRNFDKLTFFNVAQWASGATEQGSSGAPLFDANHRVVGLLAGGDSDCDYPMNDYFQMFSAAYDRYSFDSLQLKRWLNPLNGNVLQTNGAYPPTTGVRHSAADVCLIATPNPCTTEVSFSAHGRSIKCIDIYDIVGNQLITANVDGRQPVIVDVAKLQPGPYVCRVTFDNGTSESIILIRDI